MDHVERRRRILHRYRNVHRKCVTTSVGTMMVMVMTFSRFISTLRLLATIDARASIRPARMFEDISRLPSALVVVDDQVVKGTSTSAGPRPIFPALARSFSRSAPLEYNALT